jgi:predicted nucleotidyltransferase component of viral defense system
MLELGQIESFYPESYRAFKKNILREYLQYKILEILFDSKYANKLAFMGGTSIRIIYGSNRFSEDLDFDNFDLTREEFKELSEIIQNRLTLEGYAVEIKTVFKVAFHSRIAFLNILYDNGVSKHKDEKLMIRLDTEPQRTEYEPDKPIINKFDVFMRINAVPNNILLAQKLFAILNRKRVMGRDIYDAIFLFGRTRPDFGYLRSKADINHQADLKKRLLSRCEELDFEQLPRDVEPFLTNPSDTKKILLFSEYIKKIELEI